MAKWEMVRLGDVCSKGSSSIAQKDLEDKDGDFPIYGASGFIKNVDFYAQDKEYLAVVKDGAGVGRVMRLPSQSSIIGTLQYIFPKENISIAYLYYALNFMNLGKYFTGAAIPHIYFKDYQKEKLPLPPLEEQKKIAQELDSIQSLITKRKQQLEKMDLLVKAKFVEMFGEPVANPMGWEVKPLKQTTTITTGNTPSKNDIENYGNHIEWIKTDNITENMFLTTATEYLSEKGAKKGRVVEKNTILMACIAGSIKSIGRVAITDRNVSFNQQINAITPKKSIYHIYFLYYLCIFNQKYIQSNISMSLKGILSKGRLEQIEFVVPPIELQSQFADYVQQTEALKTTMHSGLEKLELLYNSKMQEYFG